MSPSEQRIADAVVDALEPRFLALQQQLDTKFGNHMGEIEDYYSQRDLKRDEDLPRD